MPISLPPIKGNSNATNETSVSGLSSEEEAVRLCRAIDKPRVHIARELGCSVESLTNWLKQADVDEGRSEGLTTNDREELGRLRRENRILREERAILKKAAAFFAREADPR